MGVIKTKDAVTPIDGIEYSRYLFAGIYHLFKTFGLFSKKTTAKSTSNLQVLSVSFLHRE